MKVVIPVAGAGTRLRPHTYTQPKPLLPVAGKPIICFIVDKLAEAGLTDFVFVIGYLGDKMQRFIEARYPSLNMEFVFQENREGSAHAVNELGKRLSAEGWERPTECPGWSTGDIVRHCCWVEGMLAGRPMPEGELDAEAHDRWAGK